MTFTGNENAQIDYSKKAPYITFPALSQIPFILHGFSTKLGGVSSGIFESMNFGSDSSQLMDTPTNIEENYRRIADSIGFDVNSIVVSKQVHKTNILKVTQADKGKGLFIPRDYDEIDGMITNQPGITLVTKYADCVPLYMVDTKQKAIGLTHSGWRGTVGKIGKLTIEEMEQHYGSNPKDIIAVVGPSICMECFEIGEEVATEFIKAFGEENKDKLLFKKSSGKYHCNLWAANRQVFLEAGLHPEHIHVSGVCTSCHSDLLFSHRKTQGKRGSLAAFLTLNV